MALENGGNKMSDSETILEEIRESRRRMSEQYGHDPAKVIEYLKTFNNKYPAQVASYCKEHPADLTETANHCVS